MGKYTKISKKKYADGGPIKKVRISDKGVVKDVPINTKEYKQYYDSKTLAKASEDPNLLIAAQDLNPVEVKAEKPTWLTFKEEAIKNYPESKFRSEYFLPALRPSDLDSLPQSAQDEYNKRINNTVAQRLLKERNLDKNWDAKTQVEAFTPYERDIILNSDYGEDLARNVRLYDSELANKESFSNSNNKADLLRRQTQATGDKLSLQNLPYVGQYIPNILDVTGGIGNMASNLGAAPDNWNRGNYLSAIGAVAAPIGVGRLASVGAPTTAQFVNNVVNPLAGTGNLIKGAVPASVKTITKAKNLREAVGTFAGIPTERSLPRLSAQDLKAYRAVQELGRLRDLNKPIADQYEYALLNLPEEHIKRIYGKSKDELTNLLKTTKESAEPYTQGIINLRRPVTNEIRSGYNIPPSDFINTPNYGPITNELDPSLIPHLVDNARYPIYDDITRSIRSIGQTKNRANAVINTKLKQGVGNYLSEYPVHRGDVKQNVPALFLKGSTRKNVQQNVADMATYGVESGDVFAGSLNTSHSSYLPQLKRTFDYAGGDKVFLTYKPMNRSGYLSQAGYTPDEIVKYLNTEIDTYISRGKLPSNIQRPFVEKGDVFLPQYGVKQYQYGGYINNDINTNYAMGGMLKRKDGSYSKRGLWDNIRANKGSGKKPTKEMLEQERKIKAKYADGGPLKYDMYGTPIESNIQPSNVERSYYDPRTDTIYLGTDYNQMDDNQKNNLLAHENYHSMQFKGDKSTFLPTDTGIKKPAMMSTDDVYYSYHNRQPIEAQQGIDDFRQANPSFNLVPDDLIYNNVVDYSQYLDPNTMEGGAKFYGDTGQPVDEDFYGKGGYIVTRSKDRKGKTHKVTGPDGTVKYFGDSKLGQHPNDPARKKAFYARHAKNLKNNPHFRAFARKTWADGGYMDKYSLGGDMQSGGNIAQRLNAGKVSRGSSGGNSFKDYARDYGNFLLDGVTGIAEGLTGAEIYNPTYNTKLGKIAGAVNNQSGKMMGKIAPMALNIVAPGVGTAVGMAGKAVGTGLNASKNEEANGQLNLGNSMLPNMLGNNMEGIAQMETMGAAGAMQFKQGGLMHINEGGTHEQNAMGGVPIGPNALVEEGETINNDFVFSDRLTPMGSKKTYAQLSKRIDSKYKLRPHDPLSKEAKQMELDNLALQQESQKEMMSYGGVMAYGGKAFTGPVTQTVLNYNQEPSSMSNFMEPESVYENPVNSQILAKGGKIYIKPENRGKFTASANRAGMGVQEFARHVLANKEDYSSTQVKRANFARNFGGKKAYGGKIYANGGGPITPYFTGPDMDETYFEPNQLPIEPTATMVGISQELPAPIGISGYNIPEGPNMENGQFATGYPKLQGVQVDSYLPNVNAFNYPDPKEVTAYPHDKYVSTNQNPYGKVGNVGYLSNLAGNLVKAGMVATSKPPIYNPSLRLNRLNSTPAERLAALEGRREIQGAKDLIRRNATSSGQYLTNASLLGASSADQMARNIANIRQGYDTQNVGIGNQEAQLNQQITAANNLAREQFRDNRLNQYNKILDSVIGANQQRFAKDVQANNYQNQILDLLKTGDYELGYENGKLTIIPRT